MDLSNGGDEDRFEALRVAAFCTALMGVLPVMLDTLDWPLVLGLLVGTFGLEGGAMDCLTRDG